MKQTKIWLTTIAALLCSLTASAHDFEVGGVYYNITSDTDLTVEVTSRNNYVNSYSGVVIIPSTVTYNGTTYSVTSIGSRTFRQCRNLTSISIPESVTNIGSSAFAYCSKLISITLPKSLTSIGDSGFLGCSSLVSITLPESVTSIGNEALRNCTSLTSITIPENSKLTNIGDNAFLGCSSLASISIPESVMSIGDNAFYDCSSLTTITIPESVTSIGSYAFCNCSGELIINCDIPSSSNFGHGPFNKSKFTKVTIGEGVTRIGEWAFLGCSSLVSITIPESVASIGSHAFRNCTSLTSISIPENSKLTSIGSYAFSECISLISSITIPERVMSIGDHAFYNCSSLTSITIPEGVTSIGDHAFYDCSSLTSITIPEGVTSIGDYTFYNCSSLISSITIPESVTNIGRNAFSGCTSLTSITIPESVTSIGSCAFYGCGGELTVNCEVPSASRYGEGSFYKGKFTKVTVGEGVTSIGSYAFEDCSNLSSITIGEGVTSIASNAFKGCSIVRTIWKCAQLPSGYSCVKGKINYIADEKYASYSDFKVYPMLNSLFEVDGITYVPTSLSERTCDVIDCVSDSTMAQLAIGEKVSFKGVELKVKEVNSYTFYGNTHIKEATLNNQGAIGNYAFHGCTALSSITLDNTVTSVGSYAFEECCQLASFTLPASVTSVGYAPFTGCSNLRSLMVDAGNSIYDSRDNCNGIVEKATNTLVAACNHTVIPESVTGIGDYAFSGCKNVANLNIPGKVKSIGRYAFNECVELQDISIPQSTTKIGDYAFYGCSSLSDVIIEDRTTALSLGSNGSSALFSSCPLDSVYIGGKITYSTSSSKGYSPFSKNTSLRTVTITDKEEKIYNYEFYGCTALTNVTIGNGVTSIGDNAFSGCSSLTGFSFGSSMKSIGASAFTGCSSIKKIVSSAVTPPVCGSLALDDINKWECVLRVPINYMDAYMAADQWKEFLFIEDVVKVERYSLKFVVDGEVYHTDSLAYSESIVLPEPPVKEGHTFGGWSEIPETMPIFDVTVTGSFTINSYPINYVVDGELYKTESVVYNDTVILADAPTKEGYTFSGWSEVPERMPADTVNVTGSFAINKYLVTFKIGDDVVVADSLDYGTAIVAPEAPEKEGYTFDGWGEVAETVPANDVTYEGSYSVNTYLLTYIVDGETVQSDSVAYGTPISVPAEPTKEGHTFSGWSEALETMPANDVIISGRFTVNKYLVTFKIGDEVIAADSLEYGTTIVAPEAPEKEGHTFSGWGEVAEIVPANDVTYEGSYSVNTYLLTYTVDGETVQTDSVAYGTEITVLVEPTKEGHTFSGWSEVPETMPASDVIISGAFTANIYKVYYYVGEELIHTVEVTYGEAIPEYVYEPTEEGHTFLGWIGDTYETMPAHDVTYTANIDNGIDQLTNDNGQLTIYDLTGRKVLDTENLRGGIYIVNGQKVFIK